MLWTMPTGSLPRIRLNRHDRCPAYINLPSTHRSIDLVLDIAQHTNFWEENPSVSWKKGELM